MPSKRRLFLPISLDRYASPISSLLREVAVRLPEWDVYSGSNPDGAVAPEVVEAVWNLPHMHRCSIPALMRKRYDIVQLASSTIKNRLLVQAAKLRSFGKAKFVFTANIEPVDYDGNLAHYAWMVPRADVLVAVSECVRESVFKRWGRRADFVIPNGADEVFFDPSLVTPPTEGRPYVIYVGSIAPRKRADLVVSLAAHFPGVDFVFAGNFPYPDYEAQCRQAAAGLENVKFLGGVDRQFLRSLLGGARAMVFPTEIEGLPLSVIEGQMMGLPVLGQPRTAMPELVTNGKNGYLIEGTDTEQWVAKLQEVIDRPDNAPHSAWRQEIRAQAVQKCSWSVVAQKYRELYASLMKS